MRIDKMILHAFGKFADKTIELKPGLNVIIGDNEVGKSTIHNFIEAMFYGFFKPYTKKKIYSEAYDHYEPWDHNGYSGSLTLTDQGKQIRLERIFTKGKDALKIYDVKSGQDITATYEYNKVTRLHDMTMAHIGFNKVAYSNTISLTQMQTRTEAELIREIKDNMSNLASSHQSTISVDKVIEEIEALEDAIGSNRKKTSLYYKQNKLIEACELELKGAEEVHGLIASGKERENQLLGELEACQENEKQIRSKISYLNYLDNLEMIQKADLLEKERLDYEQKAAALEGFKGFNRQVLLQLQEDRAVSNKLEQEILYFKDRKKTLIEDLDNLENRKGEPIEIDRLTYTYREVDRAVTTYKKDEEALRLKEQELMMVGNQLKMVDQVETFKKSSIMLLALSIIGISAVASGFLYQKIMFGFAAVVLIAFMVVVYLDKQRKKDYENDQLKVTNLQSQQIRLEKSVWDYEQGLKDLLLDQEMADIHSLRQKRDDLLKQFSLAEAKITEIHEIDRQILLQKQALEGMDKTIASFERRYQLLQEEHSVLLDKYSLDVTASMADIQGAYDHYLQYGAYKKDSDNLAKRIKDLLGGTSLEGLKQQVSNVEPVIVSKEENHETLSDALQQVQQEKLDLTELISEVMTRGHELSKSSRTVAEVEEAIVAAKAVKASYDHDLKVAEIMKTAIETIAVEIQNNFAPILNEELSRVVDWVSQGKYSEIKVNPDMLVTVFDKDLNRTVKAESLSEGTIDMLYFGLRLGVAKVLSEGKELPLILDDAFVQYDQKRLANVLDLLASQERQVIVFTCHQREVEYLEANGIDFHRVLL